MKSAFSVIDLSVGDVRWAQALPVLQELRPHLTPDSFEKLYTDAYAEGLRYTALFGDSQTCLAVAGWRIFTKSLARILYVDDLVVAEESRGSGLGKTIMDRLATKAKQSHCKFIVLDTGMERFDAQRFYETWGMNRAAYLYVKSLD